MSSPTRGGFAGNWKDIAASFFKLGATSYGGPAIIGIMQTGWIVWVDNLLHISVNAAARCGGVQSTLSPCAGPTVPNMISTATTVFGPFSGAVFLNNATCTGSGLIGTYTVSIAFVVNLTITAKSCYPNLL